MEVMLSLCNCRDYNSLVRVACDDRSTTPQKQKNEVTHTAAYYGPIELESTVTDLVTDTQNAMRSKPGRSWHTAEHPAKNDDLIGLLLVIRAARTGHTCSPLLTR